MLGSLADTALDLVASLITFFGVRWAAMPADDEHRFGHGKAEALAALVQVILISFSALAIAWRSFDRLRSGEPTQGLELGIGVSVDRDGRDLRPARLPALRDPQDRARSRS